MSPRGGPRGGGRPKGPNTARLNITIPPALAEAAKAKATKEGIPLSWLVAEGIQLYIEDSEKLAPNIRLSRAMTAAAMAKAQAEGISLSQLAEEAIEDRIGHSRYTASKENP